MAHNINVMTNIVAPKGDVDWTKYFIVLSPSNDDVTINENIATLQSIAIARGQEWIHITPTKNGICAGRTLALDVLRQYFPGTEMIRGLWLDSDIMIENASKVLEVINYADKYNINIVANYPRGNPPDYDNTIYDTVLVDGVERFDVAIQDDVLDAMENYQIVEYAGLGFYYGWIPLNYVFHTDRIGEDFYFYKDNKLELHLAKEIRLAHQQKVWLRKPHFSDA